jgi:succinate dehydrogenase / fumarate reductase iron-sulfur subunit
VSWNFEVNKKIAPFKMRQGTEPRFSQAEADRVQEFRKCIECFLCQNVCHVLRDHQAKDRFCGPRFLVRLAGLEMHPLDGQDRVPQIRQQFGIGFCNITKCCTEVCPESIHITDNAIIPLKERVVDRFYDPLKKLFRVLAGK